MTVPVMINRRAALRPDPPTTETVVPLIPVPFLSDFFPAPYIFDPFTSALNQVGFYENI